jgi:three-Cys-motif partner protein
MFRFWGDDSWRRVADAEDNQHDLFSGPKLIKKDNIAVVTAFRKSLQEVGGFKCVQEPLPMKNSNNAVIYYLFFASPKDVAQRIIEDIFAKYVALP